MERAQAIEAMTLLGNYLLSSQGDRMALANSVEGRYPYLDLEFVRFAARLPRGLKLRGLKDIGMNSRELEHFKHVLGLPHGIILVTGPTGSGKTSTLYTALNEINDAVPE